MNCPDTVIGPTSTTYSSPVSTQLLNLGRRFLAAANHAAILINSSNVFQVLHFTVERGQLFPRLAGVALYGGTGGDISTELNAFIEVVNTAELVFARKREDL